MVGDLDGRHGGPVGRGGLLFLLHFGVNLVLPQLPSFSYLKQIASDSFYWVFDHSGLLASRNIIVPHHIDHPHPTKQKSSVNICETPTMQLMTNDPMRALAPSCWENRGTPMHRQNMPEKMVPTQSYVIRSKLWCTDQRSNESLA